MIVVDKKKMGRPYTDTGNPKTIVKRARMSEEDVKKLKQCCIALGMSESDILRLGIDEIYKKIKEP